MSDLEGHPKMDSTTIMLECWEYCNDVDASFCVEVPANSNVSALKEAIKEEISTTKDVNLYYIQAPSDDKREDELRHWDPVGKEALQECTKLSTRFSVEEGFIIVDREYEPGIECHVDLNYCVSGTGPTTYSSVKISRKDTVATLRQIIRSKHAERFCYVAERDLALYRVSLPFANSIKETIQDLTLDGKDILDQSQTLFYYFPGHLNNRYLHLFVQVPLPAPASVQPRMQYIQEWAQISSASASQLGEPSNFAKLQSTDRRIEWTRTALDASTIPVTLLDPIFGQFVHDCQNHEPTRDDNSLAFEFWWEMSRFFEDGVQRQNEIARIMDQYGIQILRSHYTTRGSYVILEDRNEISSEGTESTEPYCQAIINYTKTFKDQVMKSDVPFNFPCIIVTVFGPHISFSGAVWGNRPNYQVLTSALPCFFHQTDIILRTSLSRHIGAFRKAYEALRELYWHVRVNPAHYKDLQPEFPHPRSYTSSNGKIRFRYIRVLGSSKLLFVVLTEAGEQLCVKFARRYSVEVHQQCAEWGIAPKLRGYDDIVGGWRMVVMDLLEGYQCLEDVKDTLSDEDKKTLKRDLRSWLTALHQKKFVHGDVRDANTMVTKDPFGWKLINFGSSGEIGQVRYPMNVDQSFRRPRADYDDLILADHDMEMLEHLS